MADEENLREIILTSPSGKRMIGRVSPIYDNSYVALWMYQAIGLEYDDLWAAVSKLREQFFPETATWALPLWEQRYGLISEGTDEERRQRISKAKQRNQPFTPAALESWISEMTALEVHVVELTPPSHFAVQLTYNGQVEPNIAKKIREFVMRVKPSHLFFEIQYVARGQILLETSSVYRTFNSLEEDLADLQVFFGDYISAPPTITDGVLDTIEHRIYAV